jgi:hypothetical protein
MLILSLVLALVRALHHLAIWVLARSLNMPEPLVHDTGIFVVAQVVTIENRVGRALCPKRLLRQVRSWFR